MMNVTGQRAAPERMRGRLVSLHRPMLVDRARPVPTVTSPAGRLRFLLDGGADALHRDGDLDSSRQWFDRAYRLAEREQEPSALAEAALGSGGLWVHEHRGAASSALAQARLRHALTLIDPAGTLAVRLRARLAAEADYRHGAHNRVFAAVEEARHTGDPVTLAEALSMAHHCVLGPHQAGLRSDIAQELLETSPRTTRGGDVLIALLWRTVNLFLAADRHAGRALQELRDALKSHEHLAVGFVVKAMDVMLAVRSGDLAHAAALATACTEAGQAAGDIDATGWHGAHLIMLHWYRGDMAALLPSLRELVHSPTLSAVDNSHLAALAVAAATSGDVRLARGSLARLRGTGLRSLPMTSSWLATMYAVVEAASLLEDQESAAEAYELLLPHAHLPMVAGMGVACFGSVEHALGVASMTVGEADRAVAHFEAAVRINQALQHWPAVAFSQARLAEALHRRDGTADRVAARQLCAAAQHDAAQLGIALPPVAVAVTAAPSRTGRAASVRAQLSCERRGRRWELLLGTRSLLMNSSKGMVYLAELISNPGFEIPAADLALGPGTPAQDSSGVAGPGSPQPLLDDAAKRAYRRRLFELDAAIGEYEQRNDVVRAERARDERGWLIDELAAATGLGGRTRPFADSTERARISVGKAIRRALSQIESTDAVIGAHLRANISMGMRCCYLPN